MLAEVGQFALILAFVLALLQGSVPLVGAARGDPALIAFGRAAAGVQGALVALAFACLAASFVGSDFSVALVANHSHSTQPLVYRFAATWGNHEGSMLLWVLILSGFGALVAATGGMRDRLQARVLGVQGLLGAAFLAFLLFTSNPFARLSPAPADGAELNPLLQDPGLALHPPLLYIGYVGFSVAFAFAIAALIEGRLDAAWARWVRPWVLAAWASLTAGLALGSYWAYYELGWGGWWFWDPVENAALMPWLLGTALLHCVAVLEKRGALVHWTLLLAIATFSLSLIGTFLVRSGVLTSVHAFAVDPERGVFILALIALVTGGALALFALRAPALRSEAGFAAVSREAALTANNLFLAAATATVFLGTFYPVALEAVTGDKISVGPPFYALTFVPIMAGLGLLVSAGPMLAWKRDDARATLRRLRVPAAIALAVLVATLVLGPARLLTAFGLGLSAWLVLGAAAILVRRWRLGGGSSARLVRTTPRAVWGMVLAHAGLGLTAAGVTAMAAWAADEVLVMTPGQTARVGPATVRMERVELARGPNFEALRAHFALEGGGTLVSERRFYPVAGSQTTEAAISASLLGNTYVAVGEAGQDGLVVRLYHHPLVGWIWGGAVLMALGGVLSLTDRRYRVAASVAAPAPALRPAAVPA